MLANNKVTKICEVCRDNKGVATRVSIGRQMSYKFSDEKEFIRNDEENRIRRQLIRENKLKQNECNESDNSVDTSSDNKNSELVLHKDFLRDIIANTLELSDEDLTDQISEIESYVTNDTELHESSDENELSLDHTIGKSQNFVIKPVFRELTDYKGLNQLEFSRISELLSATTIFKSHTTKNFVEITDSKQLMAYMLTVQYEQQFRKIVNFTKMLNSFTATCPDDQYSLVKNSCTEMFSLRFFTYFNDDNNSLLTAIILFNPNRPSLTHRRYVQLEQ
ncbi:unnamed protein product [Oppiella nova]|uniref:NR LBD domain-containing protein n=1 Tax=Oppiella nova TaxID=334625 RepID=A0A7R9LS35_9ACAR|nr:unnamed protein product [Oppiella nova]CAG2166423.1 unnamed protein product [Oppiella nova]